jgi:hypothetical protein
MRRGPIRPHVIEFISVMKFGSPRSSIADDEHRCGAAGQDVSGNAAKKKSGESRATARAEHNEIGTSLLRNGDNFGCRIAIPQLGINHASILAQARRSIRRNALMFKL